MKESGIHVLLAPEQLGQLWGIPLTNTLLTSWIVIALLISIALLVGRKLQLTPGKLQTFLEMLVSFVYDYITETLESRTWARRMFPLLMTIFLFIAVSNLLEFTPGIGSIGIFHGDEFLPLFRSVNTDLNVTLALAIIAVFTIEIAGIVAVGFFRYAGKFLNFSSPLNFVVGIIELVSELSRFVSFSFRLFGNIFAGEVLLAVAAFFVPYVLPVPLMSFELFIGVVQAAVFALLTLFFIKLAIAEPHGSH
ncbi:ATP synthase F0 subunit A [Candidatus Kaiserbacteria bacterium RIFCSPHIGHO2_12_FULL_53_13]|uniref:ATP synthase subunit a n=1 Tax=Candidatus Kaiserbacteria bacterium RIFCSPHIGHO2_12_FULL_53_13 TaxID=1798502 RepID=A0A1F6E8N9_9BACT|nr:MAG: ATP synthase F0 subunit A [Candidatus Kaiserbacteria bacterium RIFCSPHIGHO2_12_FULL_53_13]OGG74729.1 MAG: ATP synthase F0 subunit A [Candidatus Kaiserbacteria bacterium RIFCSPLOWO2_01_FULL_52_36]